MLLLLLTGCGQAILGAEPMAWTHVVTDTLEGAQVIDARDPDSFLAGHPPGAVNVHWTELTGFDDEGLWAHLPPEEVGELLAERGLRRDEPVVVLGGGIEGWGDDGNLYWSLRHVGHPELRVYNGGWSTWLAEGHTPATGAASLPHHPYAVDLDPEVLATSEEVATWQGVILDVRSAEEFAQGHIPGAVWMEWTEVFADGDLLLGEEAARGVLEDHGIGPDTEVIVYCQAGIRAGHTFMVLEALGLPVVKNYVGSWARWTAEGGAVETP